jgi:hypothetical protein
MDHRDGQRRYLITFSDGGSGMRRRDEPLEVGHELRDSTNRYRIVDVVEPPNTTGLGRARAERIE